MAEPRRVAEAHPSVDGAHFLIVEAPYYAEIAKLQREGAIEALREAGAQWTILTAPGALELAVATDMALEAAERNGSPYAGAIALGCVVRGETYHFEIVSNESARSLSELASRRRLALGNGVLTVENEEQAYARADRSRMDKGGDAARAALAIYRLQRALQGAR